MKARRGASRLTALVAAPPAEVLAATSARDVDPALVPMQSGLRTAAALALVPPGWHWPRWLDRQHRADHPAFVPAGDAGIVENVTGRDWHHVGTVSSGWLAMVDPRGCVAPVGGGWSLDWLVRAEDRWHRPAREAAVRQRVPDGAPAPETSCRVPGGDVVHRVYGVTLGGDAGDAIVVEVENTTAVPVAVAFAVRPVDLLGVGAISGIELDETRVLVNGRVALVLDRRPARAAFGDAIVDSISVAMAEGLEDDQTTARDDLALANGTFVVPVPHRTTVSLLMIVNGDRRTRVDAGSPRPAADAVVRGWDAHANRAATIELPDDRVRSIYAAATRNLLLASGNGQVAPPTGHEDAWTVAGEVRIVRALLSVGLDEAANAVVRRRSDEFELDGWYRREGPTLARNQAIFHAIGDSWALSRDSETIDAALGPAVKAAHWSERFRTRRARSISDNDAYAMHDALLSLSRALKGVEQPEAAQDLAAFAARFVLDHDARRPDELTDVEVPVSSRNGLDALATTERGTALARAGDERALLAVAWLAEVAGESGRWPTHVHPRLGTGCGGSGDDPCVSAAVVELVRSLAVRVDGRTIALLPVVSSSWFGQSIDVRGVPTSVGRCSYSVRWHGQRPALLWEVDVAADVRDVVVTCPALDPSFSSTAASGEALLTAPRDATRPDNMRPGPSEPAEPGESFA